MALPPAGSRPLLKSGWTEGLHPRSATGEFAGKPQARAQAAGHHRAHPRDARRFHRRPLSVPARLVIDAAQGDVNALARLKRLLGPHALALIAAAEADKMRGLLGDRFQVSNLNDPRVQRELAALYAVPAAVLRRLAAGGLRVYVGVGWPAALGAQGDAQARGHPAGATAADDGGATFQFPGAPTVVVAAGATTMPASILHELGHAIGDVLGIPPEVAAAQQADLARLDPYYQQGGGAGVEELYAQSWWAFLTDGVRGVAYLSGDPNYAAWFAGYANALRT